MRARHKPPSARATRQAVDILARLGPEALAAMVEAAIDRLDAVAPDPEMEDGDEDRCRACDDFGTRDRALLAKVRKESHDDGAGEPDDRCEAGDDGLPVGWKSWSRPAVVTRAGQSIAVLGGARL